MAVSLTWLGTNSILLDAGGSALLLDPYAGMPGAENPITLDGIAARAFDAGARDILISHNHFDHISDVSRLVRMHPSVVYTTKAGAQALVEDGCDPEAVVTVEPGCAFDIGSMQVQAFQGRHIRFDVRLVAGTLLPFNMARAKGNIPALLRLIRRYDESGETVVYEVAVDEPGHPRIQFMGSLSLDDGTDYPQGADLLVLPYQGSSFLPVHAREALMRLRPKAVMASHFDDAFPPVSSHVDTDPLKLLMEEEFPGVSLIVPKAGAPVLM